jgi:predicted secreted Zn-dependent protease
MPMSDKEPRWQRSTRCGNGTCVEVAKVDDHYLIRDSKNPDSAPLSFTKAEWEAFVAGVKRDEFLS